MRIFFKAILYICCAFPLAHQAWASPHKHEQPSMIFNEDTEYAAPAIDCTGSGISIDDPVVCLSRKNYDYVCSHTTGITKFAVMALTEVGAGADRAIPDQIYTLMAHGNYNITNIGLNDSGECIMSFSADGVVNGNSYSGSYQLTVSNFIYENHAFAISGFKSTFTPGPLY